VSLAELSYDAQKQEDFIANIRSIGRATDCTAKAAAVADALKQRLARMHKRSAAIAAAERPSVLFLLSDAPIMTAGKNTFASQMIELAGGRNVFADLEQQFPRVSEEEIINRNPEVIIMWSNDDLIPRKERLARRPGWQQLTAFRNNRILAIEDDLISRASPRLFDGLERLAELLEAPNKRGTK
jgi:iron complex transport system substrate-binding protein